MCGLVGVIGEIGRKEKIAFRNLLHFDTLRGPHSTGVISINPKNKYEWVKKVGTPWELFIDSDKFDKHALWGPETKCLIGHNRWATTGKVNTSNAHPFTHGNIIGVHNGTLDHSSFNQYINADEKNQFEVDSEGLFYHINKTSLKETINNVAGAWSLIYYNRSDRTINFLRNSKRPMCYAFSKTMSTKNDKLPQTVFCASEDWMIEMACELAKIEIGDVHETTADHHYYADLTGNSFKKKGVRFLYKQDKILAKAPIVTRYKHNHHPQRDVKSFPLYKEYQQLADKDGKIPIYFCMMDKEDHNKIAWACPLNPKINGVMHLKWMQGGTNQILKKKLQGIHGWFAAKPITYTSYQEQKVCFTVTHSDAPDEPEEFFPWNVFDWGTKGDREHDLPVSQVKCDNFEWPEDKKKEDENVLRLPFSMGNTKLKTNKGTQAQERRTYLKRVLGYL